MLDLSYAAYEHMLSNEAAAAAYSCRDFAPALRGARIGWVVAVGGEVSRPGVNEAVCIASIVALHAVVRASMREVGSGRIAKQPDFTLLVNLVSPDGSVDPVTLSNYAYLQLVDPIKHLPGASDVAMRAVTIQARVIGYLVEQGAADGTDVAVGALLYRVDASDYKAALAQAVGQRDRSTASLSYSKISKGHKQTLARDGWASRDTFDQADSTNRQNEAALATDSAALRAAALNLSRTEIRASFAGRISRSQVFEGSLTSVAGAALNTLVQLDPIYVRFNPAEANLEAINRVQARAPIETTVAVGEGALSHAGPVTFIDNVVDRTTGTILRRATIANVDRGLLPGPFVTARLHFGDQEGALTVPQSAVGASPIGRFLLAVGQNGEAEQHVIKLGDNDGDLVVVTDGLQAGERVITGQLQKLRPVAPVESEGAAPTPATK